jgi:antitoxin (DNA-binding transcriptional repressor) of toxin-antitoxin stability system
MCYMNAMTMTARHRMPINGRVGVRELRQSLSVYLARVIAGETFDVTDRGQLVAMLVPVRPGMTLVDRLVASGRATPATRRLQDLPPLTGEIPADLGEQAQRALQELREDRL